MCREVDLEDNVTNSADEQPLDVLSHVTTAWHLLQIGITCRASACNDLVVVVGRAQPPCRSEVVVVAEQTNQAFHVSVTQLVQLRNRREHLHDRMAFMLSLKCLVNLSFLLTVGAHLVTRRFRLKLHYVEEQRL